jgi:hypothetical protein
MMMAGWLASLVLTHFTSMLVWMGFLFCKPKTRDRESSSISRAATHKKKVIDKHFSFRLSSSPEAEMKGKHTREASKREAKANGINFAFFSAKPRVFFFVC